MFAGNVETCTGVAGDVVFFAPPVNTLDVSSPGGNGNVSLTGAGSSVGSGASPHFTCINNDTGCTIVLGTNGPDTCSSNPAGNNQTAGVCVAPASGAGNGPSGNAGPSITVLANSGIGGPFGFQSGFASNLGVTAAVQGVSRGSNGGNGGNAYVFGGAGDGSDGANGGLVTVTASGRVQGTNSAGVAAISFAGNGGDGGSAYVIGGSAGNGGKGGFGGDATAKLTGSGSTVFTTGNNSVGVLAFSQGGNGGNGGGGGGLVFSAGGGNGAGRGGNASVTTDAGTQITTSGNDSAGILARSLGGGGGSGSGGFGLFYSGGGSGSTGGNGGVVTVDAHGNISTSGTSSYGILAQSIGGGGGDAGSVAGAFALGGNGSAGGNGGSVNVGNSGQVTTAGVGANAIEAQSIGGTGGNGANSGGLFALGGNGSSTTQGGQVSVTNSGVLQTRAALAAGILAQSIGGGGGNGGTAGGLFAAGGSAGAGADASSVIVTNSGTIETGINGLGSASSPGILAQSIGGGGGNGGGAIAVGSGISVALGGKGGIGGSGAAVSVLRDNVNAANATAYSVTTHGNNSGAILAQSIGGGGGNGGFSVAAGANPIFQVSIGSGGAGGSAGNGGKVTVQTKGQLTTQGANSTGLLAQSIGGAGGNGGFAVAAGASLVSVSVAIGGNAGGGGSANTVTVSNLSNVTTQGPNSFGVLAQSLGGGGGNGGFDGSLAVGGIGVSVGIGGTGGAGGSSSSVQLDSTGNISTAGLNSVGIAAQSIGGGGGNGGFSVNGSIGAVGVSVGIGGTGGSGGVSGIVNLNASGSINTTSDGAIGILAQSIGGGGGSGGFSVTGALGAGLAATVGVGGSGGGGQSAADVTLDADGNGQTLTNGYGTWNISTNGRNAAGIVSQSIGGGGGNAGFAGSLALGGGAVGVTLGGGGGAGSNAGQSLVNSGTNQFANSIFTSGDNSAAVMSQSIGGGGGNGGFAAGLSGNFGGGSLQVTLGGSGGAGGTGAHAEANSIGNLTMVGNNSDGVLVQSIGGGGGNGGFSIAVSAGAGLAGAVAVGGQGNGGGSAGTVTASSRGSIRTFGQQSSGVVAQSIGGGGGNGGFAGTGSIGAVSASVGVGGNGALGGIGSTVTLTNNGDVVTSGDGSSGLIAQSIGGGGGNGGSTVGVNLGAGGSLGVNVGGKGGGGGSSGAVVVNSTGDLTTGSGALTKGNNAFGILAQSLGGGGGNGGFSGNINVGGLVAIGVSVGGFGGDGGGSSTVNVTSRGNVFTNYDNSSGVVAQSIGGGGGNGGFSFSIAASGSFEALGGAVAVSVGGFGGKAGNGAAVDLNNAGTIFTTGAISNGIEAQSIGGGGGNGGFSVAGAFTTGVAGIGVSVGGFGDGGGKAGSVTVNSSGTLANGNAVTSAPPVGTTTLLTLGEQSNGILAQSMGGGGGNGGFSAALGAALQGGGGGVSVGGFGKGGGDGDFVSVTSYNNIVTQGPKSNGILAQSIGGGGGNGGFSIGLGAGSEFGGSASVGGFGAGGGNAGAVTAKNFGTIWTQKSDSNGIAAQSIGGGGGNGGFSIAGAFTLGPAAVGVSVGGFGGTGGQASGVEVDSFAKGSAGIGTIAAPPAGTITLETDGDRSNGIVAQSLGGGGGNGGFSGAGAFSAGGAGIGVSVGGFGKGGGNGANVTVNSANNILTKGEQSNGILAQSIGGGGGNGGASVALALGSEFAGALSVGGTALGGGGTAGIVTVKNYGTIWTRKADSNGISAQSIGGGGGNGGFSVAGAFTTGVAGVALSVGGFGSIGSPGNTVEVDSYALATGGAPVLAAPVAGVTSLETDGDRSNGILAQSIGGGGGNGGFSGGIGASADGAGFTASVGGFGNGGGSASAVSVTSYNNILTKGTDSNGILAQSLGGGGGNGGFSIGLAGGTSLGASISVGGFALKGGGDGGTVSVNSFGTLATLGDRSGGVVAQSIGGSGGNGGFSLSGAFSGGNAGVSASIGGGGSGGGKGGAVVLNRNVGTTLAGNAATVETSGQSANGLEAQSIGGGGGNGGFSGAFSATANSKATIALSVGGFGAAGNRAGTVDLTSVDNILTHAGGSNGILAQSVGGGGGNGGFSFASSVSVTESTTFTLSASLGGFGGSAGDADKVTVDSTGIISTTGNHAAGAIAQSLGGGGGNGGLSVAGSFNFVSNNNVPSITASVGGFGGSGGAGRDVVVTRTGATTTLGDDSFGILAQSIGGGGGNGGLSIAGSIGGKDSKQISASVGGFGGPGSSAGAVTVTNTGAITTGSSSTRLQQLAVPGTVVVTEKVVTGTNSDGILAQSIGGGGGNGGFSFSGAVGPTGENTNVNIGVTVGGFGGSGGTSSAVQVTNRGLISTFGAAANGIAAQSLGGGGGNGGGAFTGLLSAGVAQSGGRAVNVAVSVGGKGGNGNLAGNVQVDQFGGIATQGPGANGILAQSIGGGGGTGGAANSLSLQLATSCTFTGLGLVSKVIKACQAPKNPSINVQVDVGGFGGTGNDAGTVTVNNHDVITTGGDSSSGIMAQSIGGGGGNGGQGIVGLTGLFPNADKVDIAITLVTLPISATGFAQGLGKITVGGFGGAAGNGNAVIVTNNGLIQTTGVSAYGIQAQSIGGGGGNGGNAGSGVLGIISIGGFSLASGNGGEVTVTNTPSGAATANILTTGVDSHAILAQSIGGGGGNGGSSGGLLTLGGFGGASGNGGKVTVTNDAALETDGNLAGGIIAQSIGGGGGTGGGTNLSVAAGGGLGGSSGNGGEVTVKNRNTATILTLGEQANGIFGQSIGGGGGKGGSTGLALITVGGFGGSSGNGGLVTITNDGVVETRGDNSIGIFGQSVGGSGGAGGSTFASVVTVGGYGAAGGTGGEVDIFNTATIKTGGTGSDAIRAQSIGGGGGSASGVGDPATIKGLGLLISVGGAGGGAGNGGAVNVDNSNLLMTLGERANGIYAQSVGGGGGSSGGALGLVVVGGVGGNSGNGGSITVTNRANGSIWTKGALSSAILAQSAGAGGGNVGSSYNGQTVGFFSKVGGNGTGAGIGGTVVVENSALLQTDGLASQGIFAQSIGGGGGNSFLTGIYQLAAAQPGVDITLNLGGAAGVGGNGGTVGVTNHTGANVLDKGDSSTGILAQSVGGGGGTVGDYITNSTGTLANISTNLGGNNSTGNGGGVTVGNDALVTLTGKNGIGILAQSVGGGGGIVGFTFGTGSDPVTIGGQNGASGAGGAVLVTNTGSLSISGNNSVGILAQSVGGGGGIVRPGSGVSSVTTQAGGTGNGAAVTISNTAANVTVTGDNSTGLFVQSIGGGGGAIGVAVDPPGQFGAFLFAGTAGGSGTAAATTINQTGNVTATGFNSVALQGQSMAPGGTGDITLNIFNPSPTTLSFITGGSGQGAGVFIRDGNNNKVNNAGVLTSVLDINGFAVRATGGNDVVKNAGLMIGSVDLAGGANAVINGPDAVFNSGVTVLVGAGNLVSNDGLVSPGAFNKVFATNITGNFSQSAMGIYGTDLDLQTVTADRINVTGTAAVGGKVALNLLNGAVAAGFAQPGAHDLVIVSAQGGEVHPGLSLVAPQTAVVKYSLTYPNLTDIDLSYRIDFSPIGLTNNQLSLGTAINGIQIAQNAPGFRPVAAALFSQPTVTGLGQIYDTLTGEGVAAAQETSFMTNDMFHAAINRQNAFWMSDELGDANGVTLYGDHKLGYAGTSRPHPAFANIAAQPTRLPPRTWRLWYSGNGGYARQQGDVATGSANARERGGLIAMGLDYQVSPDWLVGVAAGGSVSHWAVPDRLSSGSVDGGHVAAYSSWRTGRFYSTGSLGFDFFANEYTRRAIIPGVNIVQPGGAPIIIGGFNDKLGGRYRSNSVSGLFELGYKYAIASNVEIKPFASIQFGSLASDGFGETTVGASQSALALRFSGRTVNSVPLMLGAQISSGFELGGSMALATWAKLAWRHELNNRRSVRASFTVAPGFDFVADGARPAQDSLRATLGARLNLDATTALFATFDTDISRSSRNYIASGGVRVSW